MEIERYAAPLPPTVRELAKRLLMLRRQEARKRNRK
jgi:hypothetical protein